MATIRKRRMSAVMKVARTKADAKYPAKSVVIVEPPAVRAMPFVWRGGCPPARTSRFSDGWLLRHERLSFSARLSQHDETGWHGGERANDLSVRRLLPRPGSPGTPARSNAGSARTQGLRPAGVSYPASESGDQQGRTHRSRMARPDCFRL